MDIKREIRESILIAMEQEGMNINSLAVKTGVNRQTLYNQLTGKNDITLDTIISCSSWLDFTIDDILRRNYMESLIIP